jgi:hypothetical protein
MTSSDVLYKRRLGFPWVTFMLLASCVIVSAPLYLDARRYFLTLGVGFCDEDGVVAWWHHLVAHFVHGRGLDCGFPSTTLHLFINGALFVFHGMLAERLLGAGRIALLTFVCLAVQIGLMQALGARGHGASGMTWSYVLFVIEWLVWSWRPQRWSMFRDWVGWILVALTLFALIGLIKHWHLWNLLVSVPFWFAWRTTLRSNIVAAERGAPLDLGSGAGASAGLAAASGVLLFNAFFVAAALGGFVRPMSVLCDLGESGVTCVVDYTAHDAPAVVRWEVEVACDNDIRARASARRPMEPGTRATVLLPAKDFGRELDGCDRMRHTSVGTIAIE